MSHFVKQALLNLAADTGVDAGAPATREDWAGLAQTLGVRVIHIAERDTQVSPVRKKKNEFVNTWSVDGFVGEGQQPCELGWGSHERNFPRDGRRHDFGCGAAIWLAQPGCAWAMETPNRGLVEPDELDFRRVLEICADYLGPVAGEYTDWTPLSDRERLFPEDIDKTDPWQFKNVRVF